jgi:rhodanese-related sulfurtransferase
MLPSSRLVAPLVHDISAQELVAISPRPRVIDVREPDEFCGDLGHIPGAELVPLATLDTASRGWSKDSRYVIVCRSGGRSATAAARLVQLGFREVLNLAGGTQAYVNAGLPVDRA